MPEKDSRFLESVPQTNFRKENLSGESEPTQAAKLRFLLCKLCEFSMHNGTFDIKVRQR